MILFQLAEHFACAEDSAYGALIFVGSLAVGSVLGFVVGCAWCRIGRR